jgi:FMN hydrolase / 5-amino-6-(5-phospho-D-ribitylamino)uracil phosphatase
VPSLITFDLDNTLWDVDSVIVAAEQSMRAWLRQNVPEVVDLYNSAGLNEIRAQVLLHQPELKHNLSALRVLITQRAIESCGYGSASAERLSRKAFDVFMDGRHQVNYFEDALTTLAMLSSRYMLAALSNGNADITRLGLDRYFSFAYSAADVGRGKPHPDMFLAALERTGTRPEGAVHIGDHLDDDIAGAQSVGMHTIWVDLTHKGLPEGAIRPTRIVHALREIPAAISSIK